MLDLEREFLDEVEVGGEMVWGVVQTEDYEWGSDICGEGGWRGMFVLGKCELEFYD